MSTFRLTLCFISLSLANVLAFELRDDGDITALYQRGMHVQSTDEKTQPVSEGMVSEKLKAALAGPKTLTALKMAMRKVEGLPAPDYVMQVDLEKDALSRMLKSSFKDLMSATEASWLISDEELAHIEKRFVHKAWQLLTPALRESRRAQMPGYWLSFWAQAKTAFARAVLNDNKAVLKPELANSEGLIPVEEVVGRPKLSKRRSSSPDVFTVRTGHCTVDAEGCLLSPNFPLNYTNRDTCIIAVDPNQTGVLDVKNFSTEHLVDILIVNGVRYSGESGPQGVVPRKDMIWISDYVLSGTGFRICRNGEPAPGEAEEVVDTTTNFTVVEGNCTVDGGCVMSPNWPAGYGNSETCVIDISEHASTPLQVEEFMTEYVFDELVVNGKSYSGTEGPEGVIPAGQMIWTSDFSYNNAGWKICTVSPESDMGPANNSVFTVRMGSCKVGADGCISSPRYPDLYPNAGICTISVNTSLAGPLHSEFFSTEMGYDVITVNGMRFSGTHGPDDITPYEDIIWYSDFEAAASGWKICSKSPAADMTYPIHGDDDVNAFTLVSGECKVSEDNLCISSPYYPNHYGPSQSCTIEVSSNVTLPLRVDDFNTEWQLDALTVNGEVYSGIAGPDGVIPSGVITWTSDATVQSSGWKICVMELPQVVPDAWTTAPSSSTTESTTSTTTAAPVTTSSTTTASIWDTLSFHMNVSDVMVQALMALESKSEWFDAAANYFEKALEVLPSYVPANQSTLNWHVWYVYSSLHWLYTPWVKFVKELQPAFTNLTQAVAHSGGNSFVLGYSIYVPVWAEKFRQKVRWFISETTRLYTAMVNQTSEVLPSSLEALKVPMREFREHLNAFLQNTHGAFNLIPGYYADQVKEPFNYFGQGSCLDSQGKEYDTVEADGCAVIWCMSACRNISACKGFTLEGGIGCPRCELRIEEGGEVPSDPFWHLTWKDGNGVGPITSTAGSTADGSDKHCFRREPFNTDGWTDMMHKAVEESQEKQVNQYAAATQMWDSVIFKVKNAFAKIMAAMEGAVKKAIALDAEKLKYHTK